MSRRNIIQKTALLVGAVFLFLELLYQAQGIVGGDSGDLVTAAILHGVPHPPGYPLYTFLGFLASLLPVYTPAWRVALLSSVPSALTLIFLFLLVYRLTKQLLASIFSCAVLASTYLFFYYSITPEVFSLFLFFICSIFYMLLRFRDTHNSRDLLMAIFLFGLSLTHHQLILFLIPAFSIFLFGQRPLLQKLIKRSNHQFLRQGVAAFLLGILPLIYIPIAASGNSIINYDKANTISGFLRLIRRLDYGTFQSSGAMVDRPIERLLGSKLYFQFVFSDFYLIGVIFVIIGLFWLWRKDRVVFSTIISGILIVGPFFFFYAGFPLATKFALGTYERFLLPSYLLLTIPIGIGMARAVTLLSSLFAKILHGEGKNRFFPIVFVLLLSLYPASSLGITLWNLRGISIDKTADRLGQDTLRNVKKNAIILLSGDTSLFSTQYIRYATHYRTDTKVLHVSYLTTPYYPATVKRVFPEVVIPSSYGDSFPKEFLLANAKKFPIYSSTNYAVPDGWVWIPMGLLFELFNQKDVPSADSIANQNNAIFATYQDPTKGILNNYSYPILSEVKNVYATAALHAGKVLFQKDKLTEANQLFQKALHVGTNETAADAYILLGGTNIRLGQCHEALDNFDRAGKFLFGDTTKLYQYKALTYADCFHDEKKTQEFMSLYDVAKAKDEQPLEQWR